MNRRTWMLTTGAGAIAFAGGGLTGCTAASVFAQIQAWVPVGLSALQGILTVLAPVIGPIGGSIGVIVGLIKASFADLMAAVSEYQNAPAAQKATLLDKIKLILQDLSDNFNKFLADLNISGNPILSLVVSLVQVILNVLAGFAGALPGTPVAMRRSVRLRDGSTVTVTPKTMSLSAFKKAFNTIAEQGGHAEIDLR
jgi:predicted PurR-regulated permease PerM